MSTSHIGEIMGGPGPRIVFSGPGPGQPVHPPPHITPAATLAPAPMPTTAPAATPQVELVSPAPENIVVAWQELEPPRDAGPELIAATAKVRAQLFTRHREMVLGAVTIPDNLKRNAILQEAMGAFAARLLPITAFSTVFRDVQLAGTGVVAVPYVPLVVAASTDFNPANGYVMGDGTLQSKTVTVNKRKYQPLSFSSDQLRRQPAMALGPLIARKLEKLASDIVADVLSVVTATNYSAASFTGAANTFDSADVADLKGVADVANWPDIGRSLIVKSAYDVNLLKDTGVKAAYAFGSAEPFRMGRVPSIFGFNYHVFENLPANGENLVGIITMPSAILFVSSPIVPDEGVREALNSYDIVRHPETGLVIESRRWGNADFDQSRWVVEANYGFAVGEADALRRAVSP